MTARFSVVNGLAACGNTTSERPHEFFDHTGPTVVEAPPQMLGFLQDGLQRILADIGAIRPGQRPWQFLVLPPGFCGSVPEGRSFRRAVPHLLGGGCRAEFSGRGHDRCSGPPKEADQGLSACQGRIAAADGVYEWLPGRTLIPVFPATMSASSSCWRCWLTRSRRTISAHWSGSRCRRLASRRASRSTRTTRRGRLLSEAARLGGAMARANTYASSSPGVFYYPGRKWQFGVLEGMTYTFTRGRRSPDRCAEQRVLHGGREHTRHDGEERRPGITVSLDLPGCGRQLPQWRKYLYRLHIPSNIPANNFWSLCCRL